MKLILNGVVLLIGCYSYNFAMIEPLGSTRKRTFAQITSQFSNDNSDTIQSIVSEFENFSFKKRSDFRLGYDFKNEEELDLKIAQMQNIPLLLKQIFIPYAESQIKVCRVLKNQIPKCIVESYLPVFKDLQDNIYQCRTAFEQAFLDIDNFLIEKCIKYSCFENNQNYLNKEIVPYCNGGSPHLDFFVEDISQKIKNIIKKWDMLKTRVTCEESLEMNNKIVILYSIHFFSALKNMDCMINKMLEDLKSF